MSPAEASVKAIFPERRIVLLIACLGAFMSALHTSMVTIALPQMANYFQCSLAQVSWVMIAYLIICASFLLTCGRLGDLLAPGRLYFLGLLAFTVASAFCGLSPGLSWLVASRALQGLGASLILALAPKFIALTYGEGERGLPLGLFSTAIATGVSIGAPLGGFITNHLGWRYIFFISVPLCVLALIAGSRFLMRLPAESAWDFKTCNLRSGLILAGSVGGLFLALDWLRDRGCKDCWTLAAFGLAAGLFRLLLYLERQHHAPLLHPELWHRRTFILGSIGIVPASAAFQGTFFLLPFFLKHVYLYPPQHSGLMLAPLAVTAAIAAPLGGRLADRWGNLLILRIGAAILVVGLASLLFTDLGDSAFKLAGRFALVGFGYGIFLPPNLNEVLHGMHSSMIGLAASSVNLLKKIGAISGINLIVGVFAWEHQHHICLGPGVCLEIQYFHFAFAAMTLVAGINFITHLLCRRSMPTPSANVN
jgi:EmrB/QacA subfamily drug resistance transporter